MMSQRVVVVATSQAMTTMARARARATSRATRTTVVTRARTACAWTVPDSLSSDSRGDDKGKGNGKAGIVMDDSRDDKGKGKGFTDGIGGMGPGKGKSRGKDQDASDEWLELEHFYLDGDANVAATVAGQAGRARVLFTVPPPPPNSPNASCGTIRIVSAICHCRTIPPTPTCNRGSP